MGNKVLAKYDIRGIQSYIFHTDKLREIRAVQDLPEKIVFQAMQIAACIKSKDEKFDDGNEEDIFKSLEDKGITILDKAGGNAYIIFESEEKYREISKAMAVYILEETYSLKLVYACVECTDNFFNDYENLNKKLGSLKSSMPEPTHIGAFPFCSQDLQTGLPIADIKTINDKLEYLTRESSLKLKYHKKKNDGSDLIDSYIEGKGKDSHIAVIHIDGNNMGNRINEILKTATYDNAKSIFSSIKVRDSFKNVCDEMKEHTKDVEEYFRKTNKLKDGKKLVYALIQAGDDITYITRADIALSFTKMFLEKVSEKYMYGDSDKKYSISACAGIAFCNSHFPFADAYELAEKCCSSAKKRAKDEKNLGENGFIGNWIDFEFCTHIKNLDLETNRKRYGKAGDTELLLRPYCVSHKNCNSDINKNIKKYDFADFENRIQKINTTINRSRIKALREAYSEGATSVQIWKNMAVSRKYDIGELYDEITALFYDAIEVMDHYEPIDKI